MSVLSHFESQIEIPEKYTKLYKICTIVYYVSPICVICWNSRKWKLLTTFGLTKLHLRNIYLWNLNSTVTYRSFENKFHFFFVWLFIPEVKLRCIWLDDVGYFLNVNRWVKQIRNIGRHSKTTMMSYLTQIWHKERVVVIQRQLSNFSAISWRYGLLYTDSFIEM